jgi:NAD(P) transhydrogenase subunit beta
MTAPAQLIYVSASAMFIIGLKGLTHPRTAVRGNKLAAVAMALVVGAALLEAEVLRLEHITIGIASGAIVGAILARRIKMTAMPQLVAVFNGLGGLASALVAVAQLRAVGADGFTASTTVMVAASCAIAIGAVTFTGSGMAFAKLQGLLRSAPAAGAIRALSVLLTVAAIAAAAHLCWQPSAAGVWVLLGVGFAAGVMLVVPIGGADTPVVIALLNSCSGLAAAAAGFSLQNSALVVSGSLVGASGLLLTTLMCRAMNRSLVSVLFGATKRATAGADSDEQQQVSETTADELALILEGAQRVLVVPGYGMAVAQAQHAVRDLMNTLTARGVDVGFAIHPVAGRMPGHMNVLLAEADVPYERLLELEEANARFRETDVAIVLGANDVCNPTARDSGSGPLAGMPILDVDQARVVAVIKRSLSPGFSGVKNPLFEAPNAVMLFADAKRAVHDVVRCLSDSDL